MKKLALDKMRQELLSKEDRQKNLSGFLADSAVKHRVYHDTGWTDHG